MKQERPSGNRWMRFFGWLGVVLASIGGKLKALLPLLKFGKFGGTLISMLFSIWAYTIAFPLEFSIGLVVMMFIHEMGHVWAARLKGLEVSAPAFIPFVGALITMKRQPTNAQTEAFIAFGGPLLGTIGAYVCYLLGVFLHKEVLIVISAIGFFLNLFNLVPIHPLDGGRIATAITRWLWGLGLVLGLVYILYTGSFILMLIYFLFVLEIWSSIGIRFRGPKWKKYIVELKVESHRFDEMGVYIPGEEHRRVLPYRHYCLLDTGEHILEIGYPGVGVIGKLQFPGEVARVELVRTIRDIQPIHMYVEIHGRLGKIGGIQSNEEYYRVPTKVRWGYGLAYFALIGFLLFMMHVVGQAKLILG